MEEKKVLKNAPHYGGAARRAEGVSAPRRAEGVSEGGSEGVSFFHLADPGYYGLLKAFAKENRNHQTEGENAMWHILSGMDLGVRFRRQYIIKNYIADFACLEKRLVIEVDGGYHFTNEQIGHDIYRTKELEKYGFRVLRFTNEEVIADMERVRNDIIDNIEEINEITI